MDEVKDPPEEWRAIPGFDGYESSSAGRVRSWKKKPGHATGDRRETPLVLKPHVGRGGYLRVHVRPSTGVGKSRPVHQLVLFAFVGPRPPEHQAAHNSGDKADNRASNLRWATQRENEEDKRIHGTLKLGEDVPGCKLTAADVITIRRRLETEMPRYTAASVIARDYGVAAETIRQIRRGAAWGHVTMAGDHTKGTT